MTAGERTIDEDVERRLIEGLRANDREIMAELFDSYSSLAYGLAPVSYTHLTLPTILRV